MSFHHKQSSFTLMPHLLTRTLFPENQETPIHFLPDEFTEEPYFYRRNHFAYPSLTNASYHLPVEGVVRAPRTFSFQELLSMPSKTEKVLLECCGDKRTFFKPKVFGEQWEDGALSQALWKGVPLRTLLQYTGILESAKEVLVEGHDFGQTANLEGTFRFARSLPLEKALHPDTLIAYEFNGQAIPYKHGYPLRLIVPQWYAMASVKWVKKITVVDRPFNGPFQTKDYMYYPEKYSDVGKYPVTVMRVNSTIQQPLRWSFLKRGVHIIHGIAWTGKGQITQVDISVDHGKTWDTTSLQSQADPYAWSTWTYQWEVSEKGEYTIMSKAFDSAGRVQPTEPEWNRKGYGYHAISQVKVNVI